MAKTKKATEQELEQENTAPEGQADTMEREEENPTSKMTPEEYREKVIGKLNKLLLITKENGATDEEAHAAVLKAQKLMAKYNITMESIGTEEKVEYALESMPYSIGASVRWPLASIIAKNFACRAIQTNKRMCFLGHKLDAKAALSAFMYTWMYVKTHGEALQRERKAEGNSAHKVFNTYASGFIAGLKQKLDEQCVALSITVPDDVHEEFKRQFPITQSKTTKLVSNSMDVDAYLRGLEDGRKAMGSRELPE